MFNFYTEVWNGNTSADKAAKVKAAAVAENDEMAGHIAPLRRASAGSPLAAEQAKRSALAAELAEARALIANMGRRLNATRGQLN